MFFTTRDNEFLLLNYLDLASRKITAYGRLPPGLIEWLWDITPDGQEILFTKVDREGSDIMLVENFR